MNKSKFMYRLDYCLGLFVIGGVALNYLGIVSNMVVVMANDGYMPVIHGEGIVDDFGAIKHGVLTAQSSLPWLADIFVVRFPEITHSSLLFDWWATHMNYPIEGGLNAISIGDIMRWFGSVIFLVGLVPLLGRLIYLFLKKVMHGILYRYSEADMH